MRKATLGTPPARGVPGSRAVKDPVHVRKHLVREPGEALVKKIVSGKVQFFPTNSTIQSWGCVKREKVLNPGGRWGLWNCARMRLTDEKGGCYGSSELAIVVPRAA